ncbi:MAG: NAD(P)H-dependent oxidoreductase [Coriobacteriales bacterium]|nr:NAD(P)H-dependent oxidoreductase [Coriobacteriales bacterium]
MSLKHAHIVYCHPSGDSLTSEVRDAFIKGLDDSDKTHTISDLYGQDFQTDITESEYLRDAYYDNKLPLAADVLVEQELVNAANALVFIYPVFWSEAPALSRT